MKTEMRCDGFHYMVTTN